MTIKELIVLLQKYPEDYKVETIDFEYDRCERITKVGIWQEWGNDFPMPTEPNNTVMIGEL
jgi:hypothetical protein